MIPPFWKLKLNSGALRRRDFEFSRESGCATVRVGGICDDYVNFGPIE